MRIVVLSRHSNPFGFEGIRGLVHDGIRPQLVVVSPSKRRFETRDLAFFALISGFLAPLRQVFCRGPDLKFRHSLRRLCRELNIPHLQHGVGNQAKLAKLLREEDPDVLLVLGGWPELLTEEILSIPRTAAINLHPSLLPAFRGGDVHRWQVYHGVEHTGFTFHHMNEFFDSGPTVLQVKSRASADIFPQELAKELAHLASRYVSEALVRVGSPSPSRFKELSRPSSFDTYFPKWDWTDESFFAIDWSLTATRIRNQVHSAAQEHPSYPGFFSRLGSVSLIIRTCHIISASGQKNGVRPGRLSFNKETKTFAVETGSPAHLIRLHLVSIGGNPAGAHNPRRLPQLDLRTKLGRQILKAIIAREGAQFEPSHRS